MEKILEKVRYYLTLSGLVIIPLLVLPIFPNPYSGAKLALLSLYTVLLILLGAIKVIITGKLKLSTSPFDLGVVVLVIAYLVSGIFKTSGKMDAFVNPGTATLVATSAVYYFFIKYYLHSYKSQLKLFLIIGGALVSIVSLVSVSGLLAKIPGLPAFTQTTFFTTEGNSLFTAIYLGLTLILGIGLINQHQDTIKKLSVGFLMAIILLGVGVTVFNSLPTAKDHSLLPTFTSSWEVTFETLKKSPFIGYGAGNYSNAYNQFKPLSTNLTPNWNYSFLTARSYYLTIITETGFIGLFALIILWATIFKVAKRHFLIPDSPDILGKVGETEALVLLTILMFVFPISTTLIFIFFVLLALNSTAQIKDIDLVQGSESRGFVVKLPTLLISIPLIAISLVFGYFAGRAFLAEIYFTRAINQIAQTEKSYNLMVKSIQTNPYVDRYHFFLSRFTLALVNNTVTNKEELTDQERATLTQLLQQSISEAKAAVTVNKLKATNWQNLAEIYRAIIPFVQGADTYALGTYSQAVILDPINPNLRISLGGVYYALGRYDEAIRTFELATYTKPDLANAYYNLAVALREKGETQKAIEQMKIVLSLVEKDSSDYTLAKSELEALEQKLPVEETPQGETLNPPQGAPETVIEPPIELPEEIVEPEILPSPIPQNQGPTPQP